MPDYWFSKAIKRITGESVVISLIDTNDKIVRLGTCFEVSVLTSPAEQLLFITNSGARIILNTTAAGTVSYDLCLSNSDIYRMSSSELNEQTYVAHNYATNTFKGRIQKYDFDIQAVMHTWNESGGGNLYGYMIGNNSPYADYDFSVPFNLMPLEYKLKQFALVRGDGEWVKAQKKGDRGYICTFVDTGSALALRIVFDGYVSGTTELLDNFQYAKKTLMSIPYSVLNDPDYFDSEKDKGSDQGWKGNNSTPQGGNGRYDNYPSDNIDFPGLPTTSAIGTGFLTLYNPTAAQLQSLVDYLWTSTWIDTVKKMINNPMDAIISLTMIPVYPDSRTAANFKVGAIDTGIGSMKISNQYVIADFGYLDIPEKWGSCLDYSPYTKANIYLPYVGIRTIDLDLIMSARLYLKYYIDLLSGVAVAMIKVDKPGTSQSVFYTYDCNVGYQIPITGANYSQVISSLMNLGQAGISAYSGGLGASAVGSAITSAANVIGNKHEIESHGSLSANTGILTQYQAYVIIQQPVQSLPSSMAHDKGYTSNITSSVGSLSGYTEFDYIHVEGVPCTEDERNEIISILTSGVII